MLRTSFIIDGFNLYHSLRDAYKDLNKQSTINKQSTKWLDLTRFCKSYLPYLGKEAEFQDIHYFSAYADHRKKIDPNVINRHKDYIECLRDTGVKVEMGRFKKKTMRCNACEKFNTKFEEKETDVAISVKIIELFGCTTDLMKNWQY